MFVCFVDEALGGVCTGVQGETCKQDIDAICHKGVCVCKNNSSPANGACRQGNQYFFYVNPYPAGTENDKPLSPL